MKKCLMSLIGVVTICCILLSSSLPAFASSEYLGTDEDFSGYIIPQYEGSTYGIGPGFSEDYIDPDGDYPIIFSITAVEVHTLLASSAGGKSFNLNQLPINAKKIICKANVSHTLKDVPGYIWDVNEATKVGVCYYGYSDLHSGYVYIPVYYEYVPVASFGTTFEFEFNIADYLERGVTYYSFIKNMYDTGYISGTVTLQYSTLP